MEPPVTDPAPLVIKDCALLAMATGRLAQNLKELRDHLLDIDPDSLYYHFWGGLLHTRFEEREYSNDFAAWARHGLHDRVLAERLSVVDAAIHPDLESLRQELVEILEQRLDEKEFLAWTPPDRQFEFIRSRIVVFRTERRFHEPCALADYVGGMSSGSVFYHFIDARRRNPQHRDDFRAWLDSFGGRYEELGQCLGQIDPYFTSLADLRACLVEAFRQCLLMSAEDEPEHEQFPVRAAPSTSLRTGLSKHEREIAPAVHPSMPQGERRGQQGGLRESDE